MEEVVFEEFPETWKPVTVGDEIEGTVEEFKTVDVHGEARRLVLIATDDGVRTVWLNGVLSGKFRAGRVVEGDRIKIVYEGKKESPVSRYMYNDYRVFK